MYGCWFLIADGPAGCLTKVMDAIISAPIALTGLVLLPGKQVME